MTGVQQHQQGAANKARQAEDQVGGIQSGIDEDFTEEDKLLMDIMQMKVAAEEEKMTVNKGAEQEKETKERKSGKKPWQAG
nr:hypothetical protein BaRGS_008906 [Batillaria attramentaria]